MKKKMTKLTYTRLVLSGAIAGAALFGVMAPILGVDTSTAKELFSGLAGAGAVVAVKFAHLIWLLRLYSFDGNPIDMATIGVAFLGCLVRPIRRAWRKTGACFTANTLIVDFLNGTVLVPFMLLIGSAFSKAVLEEALKTNKLFLTIGGVIGLIFVVREFLNGDPSQQETPSSAHVPLAKIVNSERKAANAPYRAPKSKSRRR